jgi:hypothetical protein
MLIYQMVLQVLLYWFQSWRYYVLPCQTQTIIVWKSLQSGTFTQPTGLCMTGSPEDGPWRMQPRRGCVALSDIRQYPLLTFGTVHTGTIETSYHNWSMLAESVQNEFWFFFNFRICSHLSLIFLSFFSFLRLLLLRQYRLKMFVDVS